MQIAAHVLQSLRRPLPVLFCFIKWSDLYDGVSSIKEGGFKHLAAFRDDNWENTAFRNFHHGTCRCGVGPGSIDKNKIHVVFCANDPVTSDRKIVGVYANASVEMEDGYAVVTSDLAYMFENYERPTIYKLPGQGVRRWARGGNKNHEILLKDFDRLLKSEPFESIHDLGSVEEGQRRRLLVWSRHREAKMRKEKINRTLRETGSLECEAPECGFNFHETYGKLGEGFAHVHHLDALSFAPEKGQRTTLDRLKIVCANCHAMIHRFGECRPVDTLISV